MPAKLAVCTAVGHVSEIEWFSDKQRFALREYLAQCRARSQGWSPVWAGLNRKLRVKLEKVCRRTEGARFQLD